MVVAEREIIQLQTPPENVEQNVLQAIIDSTEHKEEKPKDTQPMIGERRLSHNRHREIIAIERRIHKRRDRITQINAALAAMNNALKIGETTDDMEQRREIILFERRGLSSDQTFARQEIRPYKTISQIED